MKITWKKVINPIIIGLLALVFFVATASFNYLTQDENYVKWTSPDETANYFFSKKFAEDGELAYFESAASLGNNMIMPRSLRSDAGWVKPVSFLGIILTYGGIASVFGSGIIPFLTPFFAALGIIFFYLLVNRIFKNKNIALLSAFLLASFPVYIYYTVRSMFHNILFIVYLLIAAYFIGLALDSKKTEGVWQELKTKFFSIKIDRTRLLKLLWAIIGGLFAGLAIITRTSELIWLMPAGGLVWLFYCRRFGFIKFWLFLAGLLIAIMPVIYWNSVLYDSPLKGGYNEMNRSLEEISLAGNDLLSGSKDSRLEIYKDYASVWFHKIFYFGFNKGQSVDMFERYVLQMFPLLVSLGYFGLLLLIIQNIRKFQKKYLVYLLFWFFSGTFLVFYYGSWLFNDNPNPKSFTIGNSYTRYWLPIYLMMFPLVSLAIERISTAFASLVGETRKRLARIISVGLQTAAVIYISSVGIIFVLFGSEEGLFHLYYTNLSEKKIAERVFELTDENGIIITQYYDKFFFPERRIIMGRLPDDQILRAAQDLVTEYPVYYYHFFLNEDDVRYLNERKFIDYNLEMKLIEKTGARFGLYELSMPQGKENIID